VQICSLEKKKGIPEQLCHVGIGYVEILGEKGNSLFRLKKKGNKGKNKIFKTTRVTDNRFKRSVKNDKALEEI